MKIQYLYKVTHAATGRSWELTAGSCEEAKTQIVQKLLYARNELTAEALTTQEGYGVTLLKVLPKGSYFWKINHKTNTTQTIPYVRGEYDYSAKGYDCYKFYDVCDSRTMNGEMKVTPDVTF